MAIVAASMCLGGCAKILGIGDWEGLVGGDAGADATNDAPGDVGPDAGNGRNDGGDSSVADSAASDANLADARVDGTLADASDGSPGDVAVSDVAVSDAADVLDGGPNDVGLGAEGGLPIWAENFGLTGSMNPATVAVNPSNGDIALVGDFMGTAAFGDAGDATFTSHGASGLDAFVALFDSSGKPRWSKAYGGGQFANATSVAFDSSSDLIVGGEFAGTVPLGGPSPSAVGAVDVFVLKLDPAGNTSWVRTYGTANQAQTLSTVAVDSADAIVFAGVGQAIDFDGGAQSGVYAAKLTADGALVWSDVFSTPSAQGVPTLALGPDDTVAVAGTFETSIAFGTSVENSDGGTDGFLVKLGSDGTVRWSAAYGDSAQQQISSVAVAPDDGILIAGNNGGTIDFKGTAGAITQTSIAGSLFLAKVGPDGVGQWVTTASGSMAANSATIAVNDGGRSALACTFRGTLEFGGGTPLPSVGSTTVALAAFDTDGGYRWAQAGGGPFGADASYGSSAAFPRAVSADPRGFVLAGWFGACLTNCTVSPPGTTLIFGNLPPLDAVSVHDAFLATFAP